MGGGSWPVKIHGRGGRLTAWQPAAIRRLLGHAKGLLEPALILAQDPELHILLGALAWTATLPVEQVDVAGEGDLRVGVVRQNRVLFEFRTSDVPGEIEAVTNTRREALVIVGMLYPDQPLP